MNDSPDASLKRCSKCEQLFPATLEFFYRDKKLGLRHYCRICSKAYNDGRIEYRKQRRQADIEKHREYGRQHYQIHREEVLEWQRQYYVDHHEERIEYSRQHRKSHPDLYSGIDRAHKHKRKARKLVAEGSYTPQQLQEQYQRQKSKCYYCKVKLDKVWHADHVVPLSRGGSNDISNIVIACPPCNMRKHTRMPHEWPEGNRLL